MLTTRTWTRKTLAVPWWTSIITPEHKQYVSEKYGKTGKRVSAKLFVSNNGLTLTSETVFSSKEAYEEFAADPIIRAWANTRKDYCLKNDINESVNTIIQD